MTFNEDKSPGDLIQSSDWDDFVDFAEVISGVAYDIYHSGSFYSLDYSWYTESAQKLSEKLLDISTSGSKYTQVYGWYSASSEKLSTISGSLSDRIIALGDAFNPELYITSSNSLQLFANSTNINARFPASGVAWVSVSSQYISGGMITAGEMVVMSDTISGLSAPVWPSSAVNKYYVDTISGSISTRVITLESQDIFDHELYPTSSNIYNKTWVDSFSGNIDSRIDAIESDTFNHDNYITSSNSIIRFADSSNIQSKFIKSESYNASGAFYPSSLGKGVSGQLYTHTTDTTIHFTKASIDDDYAGSSNINRNLLDTISSNLDARIDSIEADTFNHDLYITSSNSLSIFANSSNINDRFKASSGIWTFVSSQHASGGLIRAQTSRGNSTYLPNLLTALEELSTDNILDKTIGSFSCADDQLTYEIEVPDGFALLNISGHIYPGIYEAASIVLGSGTATNPKTNYVYWQLVGTTPTLMVSETHPEGNHVDAALIQVGGVSGTNYHIYSYNKYRAETNTFINRVFHRFEHEGTLYVNGFYPSAGINNIVSIDASGNFFNGVFEMNADNGLVSSNGSYFFIKSDGSFNESNTLADLNEYSNGTALPDSHRQNIVWGIVPTTPTLNDTVPIVPKLVAVLQGEPTVPYTADATARQDLYDVINYYPPNEELKKVFVPIMRTIVKPNVPELRTFDDGIYFKDIRGRITVGGGAAAATDLSGYYNIDQTNQYYYPSSIGAGISSTVSTLVSFSSNAQLLYYPSSLGKSLYDWSSNALTLYGASSHIHDDRYYTEAESLSTFAGSSNINRALLDAISGNILDKYYPSALGKGISSQVKTHIDDTTIHFTQANITTVGTIATGVWQGTAIDYNKLDTTAIPAISSNAIKGYRSGQLVVDTFIHDDYITSSNTISRFADSSNINSRFVASGVVLVSISSQSVSGGSILTHELTLINADTISGLSSPQWPSSAVNKTYVDTISGNLDAKIGSIGYGCDTVADEGTIAHSLGAIPSWINLVPSGSSPIMYSCKVDDTNITVYHSSPDSEMFFWRVGV